MKRKSRAIWGTNTTTFPTPAMTPSTMRSRRMPAGRSAVTPCCRPVVADSMAPIIGVDQVKSASNRRPITTVKASRPYTRWVRMLSSRSVHFRVSSRAIVRTSATIVSIQRYLAAMISRSRSRSVSAARARIVRTACCTGAGRSVPVPSAGSYESSDHSAQDRRAAGVPLNAE